MREWGILPKVSLCVLTAFADAVEHESDLGVE